MTPRRWWATLCVGGAVLAFAEVGTVCCTPAARAPIEGKLTTYLSDEQIACLIANHADGAGQTHVAVAAACEIGEDLTGFAIALLQMADKAHMGTDAAVSP